jgi:hypothetical protein
MRSFCEAPLSAHAIGQHLLARVDRHIHRRQAVLAHMNRHCLGGTSHVIESTHQQMPPPERRTLLPEVEDLDAPKPDCLMSVPDRQPLLNPHAPSGHSFSSRSEEKRPPRPTQPRKSLLSQSSSGRRTAEIKRSLPISKGKGENEFVKLEGWEAEGDERYVEALRVAKQMKNEEQKREKLELEDRNRRKAKDSLVNARVMYDFECRVAKLDNPKPKHRLTISELEAEVDQLPLLANEQVQTPAVEVAEFKNVTQREIELENARSYNRYNRSRTEEKPGSPRHGVRMNADTQR